jgi:hypothetical protein
MLNASDPMTDTIVKLADPGTAYNMIDHSRRIICTAFKDPGAEQCAMIK